MKTGGKYHYGREVERRYKGVWGGKGDNKERRCGEPQTPKYISLPLKKFTMHPKSFPPYCQFQLRTKFTRTENIPRTDTARTGASYGFLISERRQY